jgi:hypothetical protein
MRVVLREDCADPIYIQFFNLELRAGQIVCLRWPLPVWSALLIFRGAYAAISMEGINVV